MNADSMGSGRDSHPPWSMAVIPCSQCGKKLPEFALACPYCGSRFQVTRSGYCPQCRAVASATTADRCERCGVEMMDVKVERRPTADDSSPAAPAQEQTKFEVILKEGGRRTVDVIKVVSALTGLGLEEAMDLVEGAPNRVSRAADKADAEDIKKQLEELGATVEITAQGATSPARVPPRPQPSPTAPGTQVAVAAATTEAAKEETEAQGSSPQRLLERKPRSRRSWVILASGAGAVAAAAIVVAVLYGGGNDRAAPTASSTQVSAVTTTIAHGIQEKWKFRRGGSTHGPSAIAEGVVYAGSDDGYLYAVDAETGQEKWKFDPGSADYYSPVVSGGVVCFGVRDIGRDDVYFCAVDAATGEEKWEFRPATGFSPHVAWDGAFYFGCDDGCLYALDAETGAEEWKYTVGPVLFDPAILDGVLYVGSSVGRLYAVDTQTGHTKWTIQTGDEIGTSPVSAPAVADGVVCLGSHDGYLHALDAETGREYWKMKTAKQVSDVWSIADGVVLSGCDHDRYLCAVDIETGEEKWEFETGVWTSRPAVADGVVYVCSDDGNLHALDVQTGRENWKFKPSTGGLCSPLVIADGVVYFVGSDGYLYALPVQESARDVIKVGTVLSLTGARHSTGEAFHESYTRLVEDVQQIGGISMPDSGERLPIELVVLDDGSDAAQHLAQLEKLMDVDQVDLVVLPMSTAPLDDVAALAQEHGYRVMTGEPMALGLQTSDPYVLEFLHSMFTSSP
jgi:ribosomal protein L7/L12